MPHLRVNRFARSGVPVNEMAFAVVHEVRGAQRILDLSPLALEKGLYTDMPLADARGVVPDLVTLPEDAARDEIFLRALQRWANSYTPWSMRDAPDGLALNITGCAHLFDDEPHMACRILEDLSTRGIDAFAGIADTKAAARAAARFGQRSEPLSAAIMPPGQIKTFAEGYPIEALNTPSDTQFECRRLGLCSIGDLYPLKSADLARRFGLDLVRAYERLLGLHADPVLPEKARPVFAVRLSFPDPIGLLDDIHEALRRLISSICSKLENEGFGARSLRLTFLLADKREVQIDIGLARPGRSAGLIERQFALRLSGLDVGPGVDVMRLQATAFEPFTPKQRALSDGTRNDASDLITTLGNRLGHDRLVAWEPVSSHNPFRSFKFREALPLTRHANWPDRGVRPLLNIPHEPLKIHQAGRPPLAFSWRGQAYRTTTAHGPERIGHEWWQRHSEGTARDYWRVETGEGQRLWLSQRPQEKPPCWSVSGVLP